MIELVATIAGVLFGAIGMLMAVQQHIRALRKEWAERLEEERNRHSSAQVKAYAAERDFEHLRRHHEQLKVAVGMMQDELEKLKEHQIEFKVTLNATYNQVQGLATRFCDVSIGSPRQ